MARRKKHNYEPSPFGKRIGELQEKKGYTNQHIVDKVVNENNATIITNTQVYESYKSGKRQYPRDLDTVLKAFAKFYDVTTDYLLGIDDTPKPQIRSVQDATGLSESSVRKLMLFKDSYPNIMGMVDALISGATSEDIAYYISLYNQIYNDYKDSQSGVADSAYDMEKMQQRFLLTQSMYSYWQSVVTNALAPQFDREMQEEKDRYEYEQSQEYWENINDRPELDEWLKEDGGVIKVPKNE